MLARIFRSHRFFHDLRALSPWFCVAFLLFLIGALPAVPNRYKPHVWLAAALCALIGFFMR